MALLLSRLAMREATTMMAPPVRYKNGPNHWSVLRKRKSAKDKALAHFDDFYAKVYGDSWPHIRSALLRADKKYVAVTNNFSDTDKVQAALEMRGAMNIRSIYESQKELLNEETMSRRRRRGESDRNSNETAAVMETIRSETRSTEIQSIYPADGAVTAGLCHDSEADRSDKGDDRLKPVRLRSIDSERESTDTNSDRIVHPSADLTALSEFVPATKLKGLDDWIPESEHYSFYEKGSDFEAKVLKESSLTIPRYLNVYTFEEGNDSTFPAPKKGTIGALDYYLFDGSSLLPVLALDVRGGDVVLDMCAAPGGKALAILQTLMPKIMVVNDVSESRVKRVRDVFQQYTCDMEGLSERIYITEQDARLIDDVGVYNKILVDVPCTTDRHNLHTDENNIFKASRVKERLKLPELQAEILTNALKIVAVGGTVVYSTCSLSPIQNDGVVQAALKRAWEESSSMMVVKDLSEALKPLQCLYKFGDFGLRYGHISIPTRRKNWGPTYFCKILKVK